MNAIRFIIFVCIVFFGACQLNNHDKEIRTIDSLKNELTVSQLLLTSIDSNKVVTATNICTATIHFIESNYTDTMDIQTAVMLSDYSFTNKSLTQWFSLREDLISKIELSKNQLDTLKSDIQHEWIFGIQKSAIPDDKLDEYLSTETKLVTQLNKRCRKSVKQLNQHLAKYDSIRPKVTAIVDELKLKSETNF